MSVSRSTFKTDSDYKKGHAKVAGVTCFQVIKMPEDSDMTCQNGTNLPQT